MIEIDRQRWNLDQSLPIGPQLHRILRERIVYCDLFPGSRISESEIANAYSVSRQPVREAFIKLVEEGLIIVRPQRGTVVRKIACNSVLDARFVREAIEADIVKLLAAQPDVALITELRRQLEAQKKVANEASPNLTLLDEHFHRTLAEAAGKAGAWKFIEGLKSQMDRVRFLSLGQFSFAALILQHTAIVDTIEQGDIDGADIAIRHHLREILLELPQIIQANPSFFDEPLPDNPSGRTE